MAQIREGFSRKQRRKGVINVNKFRKRFGHTIRYSILGLWLLIAAIPILWTYSSSLKKPSEVFAIPPKLLSKPTLYNYEVVLGLIIPGELEGMTAGAPGAGRSTLPKNLMNSVAVSLSTAGITLFVGTFAAYALARIRIRGRRTVLMGLIIAQLVPPIVFLVPLYLTWRRLGLLDTQFGLMLAYLTFTLPFAIWNLRAFMLEIPVELEEAAMLDGCSRIQIVFKVILPLLRPGLVTTGIFVIVGTWNEFLLSSILTGRDAMTLAPLILSFITDKAILWGRLFAAAGLIMLPVIIFTLIVQKHIATGLTAGAVKG